MPPPTDFDRQLKFSKIQKFLGVVYPLAILLVTGYVVWVYVALICVNSNIKIKHGYRAMGAGVTFLVLFFSSAAISYLCYFRVLISNTSYCGDTNLDYYNNTAPIFICGPNGAPRICGTCKCWLPDRSHHSRVSMKCVKKFDHYCGFVGKDICFSNHKFFYQLLFYGTIASLFVLVSTAIMYARKGEYRSLPGTWIFVLISSGFGALFMGALLFRQTVFLLLNLNSHEGRNWKSRVYHFSVFFPEQMTTRVHVQSDPGDLPWDLGYSKNWRSVMGDRWYDWFLPFRRSPGDGMHYEYNPSFLHKMRLKATSS
ncbi:vacuolar membrane palmitoyltransferase Pfa5 [Schizosaccharomyces osmophilus]|uniref:Palmitoyltransferase n=1 Tax=Schizosaccharomyces osmophilus TaxID=2545709 RepID=A0AAE9WAX8_9SCHI|nr:vacuolar membrane palmitoyltransferase Pfa5 [Schizosaccharomyces osmophilus]WBW72613.1 vacuolar membrane palmitoyltransferase Pfa5 [Schizosaccharomyces osmophilus]